MKAKIKSGYVIREMKGEKVLSVVNKDGINFSKVFELNESAALLLGALINKECQIPDELADILMDNYIVDYEQATMDINELIAQLRKLNLLDVSD